MFIRVFCYSRPMARIDLYSRKNFPWIVIVAFVVAIALVFLFEDPLAQLRGFFVDQNFLWSSIVYTFLLAISVIVSPLTIAPAVPFIAKILSPQVTFFLTIIGWFVGSVGAFLAIRFFGERKLGYIFPVKILKENRQNFPKDGNFFTLLQIRLFSAIDRFSYFLGSRSTVSFSTFALVSLAGSLPTAFIFSYSADAIASGDKVLLFGLFFAVLMIFIAYVLQKGWRILESSAHVITKKGSFRAGEIFAVAALVLFFEKRSKKYRIERKESLEKDILKIEKKDNGIADSYLIDKDAPYDEVRNMFGGLREPGVRGNNIPYGVFGLVWKKFGTSIAESDHAAIRCEQEVVWGIDAEEAGITELPEGTTYIEQWTISEVIEKNYYPGVGLSKQEELDRYNEAINFAKDFLERVIDTHKQTKELEDNSQKSS